jgi:hypothetical protein
LGLFLGQTDTSAEAFTVIGEAIEEDERDGGKYFHIIVRENWATKENGRSLPKHKFGRVLYAWTHDRLDN